MKVDETNGLISKTEGYQGNDVKVEVPYAAKLMIQELQTMSIAPRLVV